MRGFWRGANSLVNDSRPKKSHKARGALKKYSDPSKWPLEEGAFERAVVEKYAADWHKCDFAICS